MDPGGDELVKEGRVDKKSCTKVEARTSADPGTGTVHEYSTCSNPWLVLENFSFKFDCSLQLKEEERMKVVVRVRREESGETWRAVVGRAGATSLSLVLVSSREDREVGCEWNSFQNFPFPTNNFSEHSSDTIVGYFHYFHY